MHRSGTSLVSRLLECLGVFIGESKQEDHESVFFLTINDWLLGQANASWDNVYNLEFIDVELESSMLKAIGYFLTSPQRQVYLGESRIARYPSIELLDINWGWKDPRSILFIDLWKKIFPGAKILILYRNPIDVAESLRRRKEKYDSEIASFIATHGITPLLKRQHKLQLSVRVGDISEGIKLWEDYTRRALAAEERYKESVLSIRYEDLLETPWPILQRVNDFLDLRAHREQIDCCCGQLEAGRRYAFMKNTELRHIYEQVKHQVIMGQLGYAEINE